MCNDYSFLRPESGIGRALQFKFLSIDAELYKSDLAVGDAAHIFGLHSHSSPCASIVEFA